MKSFLRKKEQPAEEEIEAQISPAKTAASSNFGFDEDDDDGSKKKSSKKQKSSKKGKGQQSLAAQVESANEGYEVEDDNKKSKKSSSGGGRGCCCGIFGCCTCRRLLGSFFCLAVLASVAVILWRYGPWAKDSGSDVSYYAVADSCDGCCNGLASNCDLPVNEVLFPMVHRAHSSYDNNFVGAHNNGGFEGALVAGYRALQLGTCLCERFASKVLLERDEGLGLGESNLGFCHTACGMGVRDPKDVLSNLKTFIETNKREVLVIELEMGEGSSADLRTALRRSGLLDYVYHPEDQYYIEEWPTMKELINDGTRILLFGSGDGMESCPAYDCDDGILFAGDHFARTETDGSDLDSCAPASTTSYEVDYGYFMMNHFEHNQLKMPSPRKARELNSYATLESRMESCGDGRRPNLLSVEFWDEGDVVEYARIENAGKNRAGGEYDTSLSDEEEEVTGEDEWR